MSDRPQTTTEPLTQPVVQQPATERPSPLFELRDYEIGGEKKQRKVILSPMTREVARRVFPYRPHSIYAESRYGGDVHRDDISLMASGHALHCRMCTAPTTFGFLDMGVCPDCDGRAEVNGTDPYLQTR